MELAGVTRSTPDPPGGKIVRDPRGNPTGVFQDRASFLVRRIQEESQIRRSPENIAVDNRKALDLAIQEWAF
jgi:predicted amidohydrolase YtcJ